jgi:hypothetical protein
MLFADTAEVPQEGRRIELYRATVKKARYKTQKNTK